MIQHGKPTWEVGESIGSKSMRKHWPENEREKNGKQLGNDSSPHFPLLFPCFVSFPNIVLIILLRDRLLNFANLLSSS